MGVDVLVVSEAVLMVVKDVCVYWVDEGVKMGSGYGDVMVLYGRGCIGDLAGGVDGSEGRGIG